MTRFEFVVRAVYLVLAGLAGILFLFCGMWFAYDRGDYPAVMIAAGLFLLFDVESFGERFKKKLQDRIDSAQKALDREKDRAKVLTFLRKTTRNGPEKPKK